MACHRSHPGSLSAGLPALLVLAALAAPGPAAAGESAAAARPVVSRPARVGVSPPIGTIPLPPPTAAPGAAPREVPLRVPELLSTLEPAPPRQDPLLQGRPGARQAPAALLSFEGNSNQDNEDVLGFLLTPPDTQGDVGLDHYVQWTNLTFKVFHKDGTLAAGPLPGNIFWEGFGGPCENDNAGDPIVLYDHLANRWVASQFTSPFASDGHQCFAVSQTPDPLGAYYLYDFTVSPGRFNDYPKLGLWPDGYYMTSNEFDFGFFAGVAATVFEREAMLQGLPARMVQFFPVASAEVLRFSLQPGHLEGVGVPPAGTCNPFVQAVDDEVWGDGTGPDGYQLWDFCVDWADPEQSTFEAAAFLSTAELDAELCFFSRSCIPQPNSFTGLDPLGQFTMYRATVRYTPGSPGKLLMAVNHTVDADGNSRAAIRWAELTLGASPAIVQTGTFDPGDGQSRWLGSVAFDSKGNIGLNFTRSGAAAGQFPSVYFTAHEKGVDPSGQMQAESVCVAGGGSQSSSNRWGDYSTLSLDPADGCTFWLTNEYVATSSFLDWHTRICTFRLPSCTGSGVATIAGTVTDSGSGDPLAGAMVRAGAFSTVTGADGSYVLKLAPGSHDVTAALLGFVPETAPGVAAAGGATAILDFALDPLPQHTVTGTVTDGSGAGWPLPARITISADGSAAPPVVAYSDPGTGAYQAGGLYEGVSYTFTVEALIDGYTTGNRAVAPPVADFVEDFALVADASCQAPGYSRTPLLAESFAGGIPAGWTVVNATASCGGGPGVWTTSDPGLRGNLTGGAGPFAAVDADICGDGASVATDLVSPEIDLSGLGGGDALQIDFRSDYFDLCLAGAGNQASLDVWDGSQWVTVFDFCGSHRRGPREESFTTAAANGAAAAKVRWHYAADWDWWWQVDEVALSLAACTFQGGGLIHGHVTAASPGDPVVGATVAVQGGGSTLSIASPGLGDGFYVLHAAAGPRTVDAQGPIFGTASAPVTVPNGGAVEVDLVLESGILTFTPSPLTVRVPLGSAQGVPSTLENVGPVAASYQMFEVLGLAPPAVPLAVPGPIEARPATAAPKLSQLAPTAERHPAPGQPPAGAGPLPAGAGEVLASFTTGLPGGPYGNAVSQGTLGLQTEVWLGNIAVIAGADQDIRYVSDGASSFAGTGTVVTNFPAGAVFWADMTYNPRTRSYWQLRVGGDNCVYELTAAAGFTGAKICPNFFLSQRGLAYDPLTDTYYSGSFNDGYVYQFDSRGAVLREVFVGLSIVGLAYNPRSGRLYVMQNISTSFPDVVVLDAATPFFDFIGSFDVHQPGGPSVIASFDQGGLDIDCQGRLWADDIGAGKVHVVDSGETDACLDVPWLSVSPAGGTLAAGQGQGVTVTLDGALSGPGYHPAQVWIANNTLEGPLSVPVHFTAAFHDVAQGSAFDRFIHGLAGASVTAGCSATGFCPGATLTRAQMAVWLLRARLGPLYTPPQESGFVFDDVPFGSFAAAWIEDLYFRGITSGCGGSNFCPGSAVTREQVAVFILRTLEGPFYTPPPATGLFSDVPSDNPFRPWIEELYRRGITSGCGTAPLRYCPGAPVTRGQMAVFLVTAFDLPVAP